MSNPGETHPPEKKRRRFGWLILLLLILFGAAFYLSAKGGYDWNKQLAAIKSWFAGAPKQDAPAERAVALPTFDVVRAEPTGELVVAGRAEPGWTVTLESGDLVVGQTAADKNGEWVLQPEKPLPEGDHSLSLRATDEKGERSVTGSQRVAMSIAGRAKPLVALSDEGKPTKIIQKPDEAPPAAAKPDGEQTVAATGEMKSPQGVDDAKAKPPSATEAAKPEQAVALVFNAIDYELAEQGGTIFINGVAAPDAKVQLYINNAFAGETQADAKGAWSFSARYDLPRGSHAIRGDHVDPASGRVLARAEVSFEQTEVEEKAPPIPVAEEADRKQQEIATAAVPETVRPQLPQDEPAQAGSEPARDQRDATLAATPAPSETVAAAPAPSETVAAARPEVAREARNEAAPQAKRTSAKGRTTGRASCRSVTVRRGDTLWHIAERCYGSGNRYTKIFQSNKNQIRDPDLIYPNQRFVIPR